jgi:hypothetical protein
MQKSKYNNNNNLTKSSSIKHNTIKTFPTNQNYYHDDEDHNIETILKLDTLLK